MPLTPVEVEQTQFRVAFRGYAVDEVDAFLDRVQSELARLLTEQQAGAGAAQAPSSSASGAPGGNEGQEAALRTLLLAQRTADEAVAEARAEAEQLRTAARDEADATLTSAREEAQALLASAREEAERVLAASREEAAGLDEQIAQRLEAALGDLDRRRQRLEAGIEQLRAFEREYRTRLRAYLEGQLRELDGRGGPDDDGVGVPVGAGGAAVGRPAVGAVRLTASGTASQGATGAVSTDGPARPAEAPDPAAPTTDR